MEENKFPYYSLEFTCVSNENIWINKFKGSALRGAFGNSFKKLVCAMGLEDCRSCVFSSDCPYAYVFMGIIEKQQNLRSATVNMPVPYVIEPPSSREEFIEKGTTFKFTISIFGKACKYAAHFINSIVRMGDVGLGKNKGRFNLISVDCILSNKNIYARNKTDLSNIAQGSLIEFESFPNDYGLELDFKTPFKAVQDGKLVNSISFEVIMRNILRRLQLVLHYHYRINIQVNFEDIIKKSQSISTINNNLRIYDWVRVSGRSGNKIPMSGYVGKIRFAGQMTSFIPLLKAGQILHIGKGCSMGMGEYKINY